LMFLFHRYFPDATGVPTEAGFCYEVVSLSTCNG
jgi:hypothetical protein